MKYAICLFFCCLTTVNASVIYDVNYTIGPATVTGTLEVDALGSINSATQFLNVNLLLSNTAAGILNQQLNSVSLIINNASLTAGISDLVWDGSTVASGGQALLRFTGDISSPAGLDAFNITTENDPIFYTTITLQARSPYSVEVDTITNHTLTIGTRSASVDVPQPWLLLMLGLAGLGLARSLRGGVFTSFHTFIV